MKSRLGGGPSPELWPCEVSARLNTADPEERFSVLLETAEAELLRLRSGSSRSPAGGLTRAAVAVGRVLGYVEAIAYLDIKVGETALDSTHRLLAELEETCAALK